MMEQNEFRIEGRNAVIEAFHSGFLFFGNIVDVRHFCI